MGDYAPSHYIECGGTKFGKTSWLLHHLGHPAKEITREEFEEADLSSKEDGYICVVTNGHPPVGFDAALHVITDHDRIMIIEGIHHGDSRPMKFIRGALDEISQHSGYSAWLEERGLSF